MPDFIVTDVLRYANQVIARFGFSVHIAILPKLFRLDASDE